MSVTNYDGEGVLQEIGGLAHGDREITRSPATPSTANLLDMQKVKP